MEGRTIPTIRRNRLIGTYQAIFGHRIKLLTAHIRACDADVSRMQMGPRDLILINSPESIQDVLVDHAADFHRGPGMKLYMRPVLGQGLLTSDDEYHRHQRKLVAPAFQHRRVAAYADVMAQYAELGQQAWRDGAKVDIAREMMKITLGIVGKTLFDADLLSEADKIGDSITISMEYAIRQLRTPIHIPLHWNTPGNRRARQAIARLNETVFRMIADRRASGEDKGDLLSMLLLAQHEDDGSHLTDDQVRDEAMNLFLAGHETTANATAWAWYLLAQHPEIYNKMQAEIDAALGGRLPAFTDLPNLPYTLQVFKEAMRLYPPAYIIIRQAIRDTTVCGYPIPNGALLAVCPYIMHRKPEYFPEPEQFLPERFTLEFEKSLPRYAYMPFGGGAHVCIGNQFALMEGHLLLAALAQRVTFRLVPGQHITTQPLITLRPYPGIHVTVHRR